MLQYRRPGFKAATRSQQFTSEEPTEEIRHLKRRAVLLLAPDRPLGPHAANGTSRPASTASFEAVSRLGWLWGGGGGTGRCSRSSLANAPTNLPASAHAHAHGALHGSHLYRQAQEVNKARAFGLAARHSTTDLVVPQTTRGVQGESHQLDRACSGSVHSGLNRSPKPRPVPFHSRDKAPLQASVAPLAAWNAELAYVQAHKRGVKS